MSRPDPIPQTCAGGVVVRQRAGRDEVCLVRRARHGPQTWNLPKGHPEPGEDLAATAVREVREETGLTGRILAPLQPIQYQFTLKDSPATYAKTVHFFLMKSVAGSVSDHDAEVLEARWMSFEDALARLTYDNERQVLRQAKDYLIEHSAHSTEHTEHDK